jgi:glycosyltransferase involved in cell wall biosynthesis
MSDTPLISVVSPVFGAEGIVPELVTRIISAVRPLGSFEIVLVDDRSEDDGWREIVEQSRLHAEVRGIRLSRNSGQHTAIAAGLAEARGDYVVVMDCDLQDDPAEIPRLLAAARDGHDVVLTEHPLRRHGWFRNLGARCYLHLVELLTGDDSETVGRGSYSLLTRKVVDCYNEIGDTHAHYLLNLKYLGFDQAHIEVRHDERYAGASSYTFGRLVHHGVDGIVANSVRLLNLVVVAGLALVGLSAIGIVALIVNYFVRGALAGFTSLMVVLLLMTGAVVCSIGVVGIYVGSIFEQTRSRPRFFVDQRIGQTGVEE